MPTALLGLLKLCLLALVYLFFVRVLWAVWNEVRAPAAGGADVGPAAHAPAGPRPGRRTPPPAMERSLPASRLTVTSSGEAKGLVLELAGTDEVTFGRAPSCSASIPSDTYLSQMHARVFVDGGQAYLEDLGSTNGTWLNGERIVAVAPIDAGDRVQVGGTVVEVT